ncbi:SAM-dependent methyltransferase [Streptosporangium sp. NPDC004631]
MSPSKPERPRLDTTVPSAGRITDYLLGGKDNFAADRKTAETVLAIAPELPMLWREGRRFLSRTVRFLAEEAGIRQFIDLGCGLPTYGNVHDIAQSVAPEARVVYVDNDPMVVVRGQAMLQDDQRTVVIEADVREPEKLLSHPRLTEMIDLEQPVAILVLALLQDLTDDAVATQVMDHLRKEIVPGSHMAISHPVRDLCPERTAKLSTVYQDAGAITGPRRENLRRKAEVEPFFDGLTLVEPGFVYIPYWRPDGTMLPQPDAVWVVGGVGRKD